ncbi:MAG TPA: carbon monoxide dehydrogenase subunit G [Actinomycetales bacterium]|nr:carbon monoxide dehydrogenase subunit G [Actinomycetales bacterium]
MKVTGTATLQAPPAKVFSALNDPEVLLATIPGCTALTRLEVDRYAMTVVAGVASIKGAYSGEVALRDQEEPSAFTLHAKGAGAPGTVDATVRVRLEENGDGTTVSYDADAVVGGMVGGVGQRMLTGVSKKMAAQFFGNVDTVLVEGLPAAASAQVAAPATTSADVAPVGRVDDGRVPFWVVLAGVGAGAFWALAGVLVGYRIARRR